MWFENWTTYLLLSLPFYSPAPPPLLYKALPTCFPNCNYVAGFAGPGFFGCVCTTARADAPVSLGSAPYPCSGKAGDQSR